tara:strand:- start:33 stop:845 length:813 start_codon:yes stop_codon:yes gene_type:complete
MTWGGGFTHGALVKVADEKEINYCDCIKYVRLRKKLKDTYHGPFYGVAPNEIEIGNCGPNRGKWINSNNNCTFEIARKSITYPQKLAKLLDAELYDLSKPGESCSYVTRTIIDFFLDRLDEDLSDYIVLLQMPVGNRFEYWHDEWQRWVPVMVANSDERNIVEYFGSEEFEFYSTFNNIMQIGTFLKEHNIRYYISTDGLGFQDEAYKHKDIKRKVDYVNKFFSILGGELVNSTLINGVNDEHIIPGDGHYNIYGHDCAANNIYRLINDR